MEQAARFWTFNQNNSGGSFDYQPNDGVTKFVVIEANSAIHAMQRALDIGLYFNGCDSGTDCSCCGDRWSEPWDESGDAEPLIYDCPVDAYAPTFGRGWMEEGKEICVHYLDGRKVWHGCIKVAA